jgi:hypothetical protein
MKLFERILGGIVVFAACVGVVAAMLPALMPSLIVLAVLVAALRLVWFYTRGW